MRKFLLGVLLLPALALAEPVKVDKTVVCDSAKEMLPFFYEKYGEQPIWMGDVVDNTKMAILANFETKTWTLVQFAVDIDAACMIDTGTDFKFKLPNML